MNQIEILSNIEKDINTDIASIINKLDGEKLLLYILMQQELMFSNLVDEKIENKEKLSEGFSYVINIIVHFKKIKLNNINKFNINPYILKHKTLIDSLIALLSVKNVVTDFKIYINKQGYSLLADKKIIKIEHSIKNYKKYYSLGYLRVVIEDHFVSAMSLKHNNSTINKVVQKAYENKIEFHKIMDKGTNQERIRFLVSNLLINLLINMGDSNSQYIIMSTYRNYFKNSNIDISERCHKKNKITWEDLLKASIGISNLATFMDRTIKEQCTSELMLNNSLIYPFSDDNLFKTFEMLFHEINPDIPEKEIKIFIKKFTTDYTSLNLSDKADIQFKPIIKVMKNVNFILFRTFSGTNLIRAYLSNSKQALDDQGNKFEKQVEDIIALNFSDVQSSVKYTNIEGKKGEIDLCFLGDNNIYFIECKNRIHPISASSSINNYEYVMKASQEQLPRAVDYFNTNRKKFIQSHFSKEIKNIDEYKVHQIIILSNRNLSGLNIEDVAVRDIFSIEKTIEVGFIEMGQTSLKSEEYLPGEIEKIHLWKNKTTFQEIDFLNYISNDSIYFKFLEETVAIEQTREYKYKDYVFKDELYAFNAFVKAKELTKPSTEQ